MASYNIPDTYKDKFKALLGTLENDTDLKFSINVHQIGEYSNDDFKIGYIYDRNNKIKVFNALDKYKELEGVYTSYDDLIKHINHRNKNYHIYIIMKF